MKSQWTPDNQNSWQNWLQGDMEKNERRNSAENAKVDISEDVYF